MSEQTITDMLEHLEAACNAANDSTDCRSELILGFGIRQRTLVAGCTRSSSTRCTRRLHGTQDDAWLRGVSQSE
jgi:hypothetical protein